VSGISAGRHTIVPDDVDCHCDLSIGSFCSIASGLQIVSGQHPAVRHRKAVSNFPFAEHGWGEYPESEMDGNVQIGNDVWIGQRVTILAGVQIADGANIGAGAVVTRNVRPYATVTGNPAREVGRRFRDDKIQALLKIAWWEWPDEKIKEGLPEMAHIKDFVRKYGPAVGLGGVW
jgi:acetyltransferase-like isoleucine patch superfamily enzyme